MKNILKFLTVTTLMGLLLSSVAFAKKDNPETTFDGLERVAKSKADLLYVLPAADLSGYNRVIILEPEIAFRKDWQSNQNSSRGANRISNRDMDRMIKEGQKIFLDEFSKVLEKKGYATAEEPDDDVLLVRPAIVDLDVKAPDPNRTNSMWNRVYTESAGDATLVIELYDSVTKQILVRAVDHKRDIGDSFGFGVPRTQHTNIMDARDAFASWARMLARGLDMAKEAKD
ncbi:MAG: DUF3313 family protein [Puniceicoccaceae bacterium]